MMAFWVAAIVVLIDKMEYTPAAIVFLSAITKISFDYFLPIKLLLIGFLIYKRFVITFSKLHLPAEQLYQQQRNHLQLLLICVFIDVCFDNPSEYLYLTLIPILFEISTFPRISILILYQTFYPLENEIAARGVLIFFTAWNIFVGPRQFRLCKRAKEIIKIEKLE